MNLIDALRDSGLAGRGGAAFSTVLKLELAQRHRARLIVNACDGEIGALKDEYVVAAHLDELCEGAELIGAKHVKYAAHRGSHTLDLLQQAGLPTLEVPDRYVSSEESSLVNLASGGLARPVSKPQPIAAGAVAPDGSRLVPTLVLNAETVWRVAQVASNGPGWFRSFGTHPEPGPRLVSITGAVDYPGVLETEAGVPLAELLHRASAAPNAAANVGGLSGGFLTAQEASQVRWSTDSLSAYRLRIGLGVIRVLDPAECVWDQIQPMIDYAAGESAGQCGPCMFGLPSVAADTRLLVSGSTDPVVAQRLRMRLGQLPGRGACRHPDGVASFVSSALETFGEELRAHAAGHCSAARPSQALEVNRREPVSI